MAREDRRGFKWLRSGFVAAAILGLTLTYPPQLGADELLVSGFFSDSIGRFDANSGAFIANIQGNGLDGTLAARVGGDGLLYVASEGSNEVKRYNRFTGDFIDDFVAAGAGGLNGPSGVTWDSDGNLLVASFNGDSILRYDGESGAFLNTAVATGFGGLNGPDNGTIVGPDGMLYVPSYNTNQILRYDLNAGTSEVFINGIFRPRVLVFQDGQLFVTSEATDAVQRYDLDGSFVDNFIQPGSSILDEPVGLAFANGSWFVSSASADKVLQFDATGGLINADFISSGSGGLNGPVFITSIAAVPEPIAVIPGLLGLLALGLTRSRTVDVQRDEQASLPA